MYSHASRGQASISLVLLIGGIATAVIVTIAIVAIGSIASGFGADQQQRARAAALAGIEDGVLRLTRNPADSGTFTVFSGNATATITITQNSPGAGRASIISEATSGVRRSTLYGIYAIDPFTGIPTPVSLTPQ